MSKTKRIHRKRNISIPIAMVAGAVPGAAHLWSVRNQSWVGARASMIYLGWDPNVGHFDFSMLGTGTVPLLLGFVVHKIASAVGINRAIRRTGIPWIAI